MTGKISAFTDLIKYKLSSAVVLSSVTGYYLFSNVFGLHLIFLATGIFLLSSGSAALNQYTERRSDSLMERTKNRPVPSKRISEKRALLIASLLLFSGSAFLILNGITPFLLGILTVLLYNFFYTRLKKLTILSIIPGALVGAIPPMIGYSSAGGDIFNKSIIAFSVFMFVWQLPHFWLIILKYGEEYKSAGFATISKYLSEIQIRYLVFFWVLFSTVFLFFILAGTIDRIMFICLAVLNLTFIFFFYRLLFQKKESREIKGAFILINSITFLIMFFLIATSIITGL
jgi:heme o synthase